MACSGQCTNQEENKPQLLSGVTQVHVVHLISPERGRHCVLCTGQSRVLLSMLPLVN